MASHEYTLSAHFPKQTLLIIISYHHITHNTLLLINLLSMISSSQRSSPQIFFVSAYLLMRLIHQMLLVFAVNKLISIVYILPLEKDSIFFHLWLFIITSILLFFIFSHSIHTFSSIITACFSHYYIRTAGTTAITA